MRVEHFPDSKLVTRIVTSYGHWHYIERWIHDDALLQPETEWIFVNDQPSDPPPAELEERILKMGCLLRNPVNFGRCGARNRGIHLASGIWTDVVDGDDIPLPLPVDWLREAERKPVVHFNVRHHRDESGRVVHEEDIGWKPSELNLLFEELTGHWDVRPVSVLWRTSELRRLGGFDGRADYSEDFNLAIRARLAGLPSERTDRVKASYQRDTPNRRFPPLAPLGMVSNLEMARPLAVTEEGRSRLETFLKFHRSELLWKSMQELSNEGIGVFGKLKHGSKWVLNRL